jgi:hypothetical protein
LAAAPMPPRIHLAPLRQLRRRTSTCRLRSRRTAGVIGRGGPASSRVSIGSPPWRSFDFTSFAA